MQSPTTRPRGNSKPPSLSEKRSPAESLTQKRRCEFSSKTPHASRFCMNNSNRTAWFGLNSSRASLPCRKLKLRKEACCNEALLYLLHHRARVRRNWVGNVSRRRADAGAAVEICARGTARLSGGEGFLHAP